MLCTGIHLPVNMLNKAGGASWMKYPYDTNLMNHFTQKKNFNPKSLLILIITDHYYI